MSAACFVPRVAAMAKPPHGKPCNRCGVCCYVSPCPLASAIFDIPELSGPCPALMGKPGDTSCGLIEHPELFSPIQTAINGNEKMSKAATLLISAGEGCDCRINGEPRDLEFHAKLLRLDDERSVEIKEAKQIWTT